VDAARAVRCVVRSEAEHLQKHKEEVAADEDELQWELAVSREATPIIVLSDGE
jgi:hypothetical protein